METSFECRSYRSSIIEPITPDVEDTENKIPNSDISFGECQFVKVLVFSFESHRLSRKDLLNPFAVRLADLFDNAMLVYWTRGPQRTTLILTGLDKNFNLGYMCNQSTTVRRGYQYYNSGLRFSTYFAVRKPVLNPI